MFLRTGLVLLLTTVSLVPAAHADTAAVATAAALGVIDPFSAGIGGGGYFVYYDVRTGRVSTLDGRETAPRAADENLFVENGKPLPFAEAMTSGLAVGVPGAPKTWQEALTRWGTLGLRDAMAPAEALARRGFVVDQTFNTQIRNNGVFRNPQLADTYRELATTGLLSLHTGAIGQDVVRTVQHPPVVPGSTRNVRPGKMELLDLTRYRVEQREPIRVGYRGLDVYSMGPSSGGGTTVGEALNILESADLAKASDVQHLHRFIESTKLSFADRNRWVGDPRYSDVPTEELLSQRYADSRACLIKPNAVLPAPLAAGDPRNPRACAAAAEASPSRQDVENTTHLVVTDRWGNAVAEPVRRGGGAARVVCEG